jgi:hypothetical protein
MHGQKNIKEAETVTLLQFLNQLQATRLFFFFGNVPAGKKFPTFVESDFSSSCSQITTWILP